MQRHQELLLESIARFGDLLRDWYQAVQDRDYAAAEREYPALDSAWDGVEGSWARLQLAREESQKGTA